MTSDMSPIPVLALFLTSAVTMASPIPNNALPDLVEKILPSVVNISSTTVTDVRVFGMEEFFQFWGVPQEYPQTSLGTGFILDKDGFVMTNAHVVDHATEVMVTLNDKREFAARIVGKDQKLDLAILQIRDKDKKVPANLVPSTFGDSNAVRIAESVFAVGNPMGLGHTVTMGIISAKNRTIGVGPFDNFLQTDASINPGNSGGPLFNLKGEVIGINTVIYSRVGQSGGLGFAIPAISATQVIPDLKRYGRVPRPWLGVLARELSPALVRHYRLPVEKGVLVYNLVRNAPAASAGIKQGDIIVGMDQTEVGNPDELERVLANRKPNESAKLKIKRGNRSLDLSVKFEELPRLDNLPKGII